MTDFVTIVEVGPRDGLQNEKQTLSATTKIELIERLANDEVESRAASIRERREIIDLFVQHFREAVEGKKVKADPVDFDRLVRLDHFLAGEADSRVEHTGTVTLEALQQRHTAVRNKVAVMDPALTGQADNALDHSLSVFR